VTRMIEKSCQERYFSSKVVVVHKKQARQLDSRQ
jgi:hypothetical protein